MNITFWGTRGSTATCKKEYLRYGGNTPCIEIKHENTSVVLDAGYGFVSLGKKIMQNAHHPSHIHLLLSHMHWDHIQGIPFFDPIWDKKFHISVYGYNRFSKNLRHIIDNQFSLNYSPIGTIKNLNAQFEFTEIDIQSFKIGALTITPFKVFHTSDTVGYRICDGSHTICYTADCEIRNSKDQDDLIQNIYGSDIVIHDTMYSGHDYKTHRNWGHCSFEKAAEICSQAHVKTCIPFHYNPDYTDDLIDGFVSYVQQKYKEKIHISPAIEGNTIIL